MFSRHMRTSIIVSTGSFIYLSEKPENIEIISYQESD